MPSVVSSPATESARLTALLVERDATIQALRKRVVEVERDLKSLAAQFQKFVSLAHGTEHLIAEGQLNLFERVGPAEPEPVETPEHAEEAPDGESAEDKIERRRRPKRPARKINTADLERRIVTHEVPDKERFCPDTGVPLIPVGERTSEEIEFIKGKVVLIVHQQVIYGPTPEVAEDRQIKTQVAPLPPRPLEGCCASASLLAHMLAQKYVLHMPLYRQEQAFAQIGLTISRQTLCDWVMKAAFELRPIASEVEREIRAGPVLQLDDTPVKCMLKGKNSTRKKLRQSYLWTFVNPKVKGVAFRFTRGRTTQDLKPLLQGAESEILVGDGYAGNKSAAREAGLQVEHAACWAHVLRKFKDATSEASSMVRLYRDDFRVLYDIEEEARERKLNAPEISKLRVEKARPVIARILKRTRGWKQTFSSNGKMADAIKYLINSRRALLTYLTRGDVPIDNNACERSIRPVAIGRRNWLFAGSERGGEAAAILYTLIESCKACGVDSETYLADVLRRMATHSSNEVGKLTPANWQPAQD